MLTKRSKSLSIAVLAIMMSLALAFGVFSVAPTANAATVDGTYTSMTTSADGNTIEWSIIGSSTTIAQKGATATDNGIVFVSTSSGKISTTSSSGMIVQLKNTASMYIPVPAGLPGTLTITANSNAADREAHINGDATKAVVMSRTGSSCDYAVSDIVAYEGSGSYIQLVSASDFKFAKIKIQATAPSSYDVDFDTQGGSAVSSMEGVTAGGNISLPAAPTKTGYSFAGWNVNADGSGDELAAGAQVAVNANATYYAIWTANTTALTIGGAPYTATYGEKLEGVEPVAGEGVFQGFFTAEVDGVKVIDEYGALIANVDGYTDAEGNWIYCANESNALTLYAQYSNECVITFVAGLDGAENPIQASLEIGGTGVLPQAPIGASADYTFIGWYENGELVGVEGAEYSATANRTLTAYWSVDVVSVDLIEETVNQDAVYEMPEKVVANYADGTIEVPVTWNTEITTAVAGLFKATGELENVTIDNIVYEISLGLVAELQVNVYKKVGTTYTVNFAVTANEFDTVWAETNIAKDGVEVALSADVTSDTGHPQTKSMLKVASGSTQAITLTIPANVTSGYIRVKAAAYSTGKNGSVAITPAGGTAVTADISATAVNEPDGTAFVEATTATAELTLTAGGTYYIGATSGSNIYLTSIEVYADATVYEEVEYYTVKFDANYDGAEVIEDITWSENEVAPALPTVARDGYELLGWFNGDELVDALSKDLHTYTLTAKWLSETALDATEAVKVEEEINYGADYSLPSVVTVVLEDTTQAEVAVKWNNAVINNKDIGTVQTFTGVLFSEEYDVRAITATAEIVVLDTRKVVTAVGVYEFETYYGVEAKLPATIEVTVGEGVDAEQVSIGVTWDAYSCDSNAPITVIGELDGSGDYKVEEVSQVSATVNVVFAPQNAKSIKFTNLTALTQISSYGYATSGTISIDGGLKIASNNGKISFNVVKGTQIVFKASSSNANVSYYDANGALQTVAVVEGINVIDAFEGEFAIVTTSQDAFVVEYINIMNGITESFVATANGAFPAAFDTETHVFLGWTVDGTIIDTATAQTVEGTEYLAVYAQLAVAPGAAIRIHGANADATLDNSALRFTIVINFANAKLADIYSNVATLANVYQFVIYNTATEVNIDAVSISTLVLVEDNFVGILAYVEKVASSGLVDVELQAQANLVGKEVVLGSAISAATVATKALADIQTTADDVYATVVEGGYSRFIAEELESIALYLEFVEEPGQDPEQPGQDPEQPGQDPEEPGQDPEEPGQDPEEPGVSLVFTEAEVLSASKVFVEGAITAVASTSKTITIDESAKTVGEKTFTHRLKFSGQMKSDCNHIAITVTGPSHLVVYAISGSATETRSLLLTSDLANNTIATALSVREVPGDQVIIVTYNLQEAGTYYIGSASGGINLYGIEITDGVEEHVFDTENWTSNKNTHWHACTNANCQERGDEASHDYDGGVETKPATAEEAGIMLYTCQTCGYEKEEEIPILDPNYQEGVVTSDVLLVFEESDIATLDAETKLVNGINAVASTSKTIAIDANNKTYGDLSFTHRLKFGGGMSDAGRYLTVTVSGPCTITVYGMSASGSADRLILITDSVANNSQETALASVLANGSTLSAVTYEVTEAGTYYIGSPESVNIYGVSVTFPTVA